MRISEILKHSVLLLLFAALSTVAAPWFFLCELSVNFMLHYALAALLLLLLLLRQKSSFTLRLLACSLVFYFLLGTFRPLINWGAGPDSGESRGEAHTELSVLQFNISVRNKRLAELVTELTKDHSELWSKAPEIVVLQEVSSRHLEVLEPLKKLYPHYRLSPEESAFGWAVFSKFEIGGSYKNPLVPASLSLKLNIRDQAPLFLIQAHTPPPVRAGLLELRNFQLMNLATYARYLREHNAILLGDFNITPYSPVFRELERVSQYQSNLRASVPWGTWPSQLPAALRISIDHLLVSPSVEILSRSVLADLGSDHLPVQTTLRLYRRVPPSMP